MMISQTSQQNNKEKRKKKQVAGYLFAKYLVRRAEDVMVKGTHS